MLLASGGPLEKKGRVVDYAKDRFTGEAIHASEAHKGAHRYICPGCGASVFRKGGYAGSYKRAFFAHRPGEGDPECENYHFGAGIAHPEGPQPRPLSLYVFVPQPADVTPSWDLQLLIPAPPDRTVTTGHVVIDTAARGIIRIPVASIGDGGSRISVRTQCEPYGVRPLGIVDPSYLRKLATHAPGLRTTKLDVFRFSDRGGHRLERRTPLLWGQGYYVVWHSSLPIAWAPGLWRRQLRNNEDWCCAEIELPDQESITIARWVRQYLERDVEAAPLDVTIVAPVPLDESPNGEITIPAGQNIIIGITARLGVLPPERLCIQRDDRRIETVTLHGECPMLVSLGHGEVGSLEVLLPDCDIGPLHLRVEQVEAPVDVVGVSFVFRDHNLTSEEVAWPAYCREVESLFLNVRASMMDLSAIHLPLRVRPNLYGIDPDDQASNRPLQENHLEDILAVGTAQSAEDSRSAWQKYTDYVRQTIVAMCMNPSLSYNVDFSNYGCLHIGTAVKPSIRSVTLTLPPPLRRQLQWVLSLGLSGTPSILNTPGDSLRLLQQKRTALSLYRRLVAEDQQLVQRFLERPQWPVAAEAHLRKLARELYATINGNDLVAE